MAMQTTTKPTQTLATEEGTSTVQKGRGPPDDMPNPSWFGGSGFPYRTPGRGDGGDDGGGGGGRGGGPPRAAGPGRNPDDRNNGTKLSGKEPVAFDGDRSKAEAIYSNGPSIGCSMESKTSCDNPSPRLCSSSPSSKAPTSKNGQACKSGG